VFVVHGALGRDAASWLLLGEDAVLGRRAWLSLRPAAAPPLTDVRRDLGRLTRPRWLSAGTEGPWRWDAFAAPRAEPVAEAVARQGPLDWRRTRLLLEQLLEEVQAAVTDGTLPEAPGVEQLWLGPSGGVQWVDSFLRSEAGPATPVEMPEGRILS